MAGESILGRAKIPISGDLKQLDKDLTEAKGKVGRAVDNIVSSVGKVGKAALVGVGVVGGAAAAAAVGLSKLAIDAAPVEGLQMAFEGLATSSGSSMDEMLAALQRGSSGMIAQRDLMASYNQAAQLVSLTFANQLPDAMQYLGKVSAATGQDMGFMLDSLVKGVGRLSPMILDNLGIQVSLSEATERASAEFGVEAEELSKAQVQAGMMSVVLEKLAKNTAAMPDVSQSAAAGMARWKATIQDTKDRIGMALLPTLNTVMGVISDLAARILPPLVEFFEQRIAPAFEMVAGVVQRFIAAVMSGESPLQALQAALEELGLGPVAEFIGQVVAKVEELIEAVRPWVEQAVDWIKQNVELKDVLIALGIAIAAVVVPAIISAMTAAAPVVAVIVALIAVVALLRKAWESDFLGIRTFVENALAKIREWWEEHGEEVIAKAKEIYETVKGAIETAIERAKEIIGLALAVIRAWWAEHGEEIMAKAEEIWERVVATFEWFKEIFTGIFEAFRSAFEGDWRGFGEKLREVWDSIWEKIKTILSNAWEAIRGIISNLISSVIEKFRSTDWGAVGKGIIQGIIDGIKAAWDWLIQTMIDLARAALDAALGFLGIESPSMTFRTEVGVPTIEGWLQGLEDGISKMERMGIRLAAATIPAVPEMPTWAGNGAPVGYTIQNYFGPGSVRSEEDIYRLVEEMDRSLNLRGLQRILD